MDELHGLADKLFTEIDHLERAMDSDELTEDRIALAIAATKRVRRDCTILLRALAERRDH
jgi:hypothetical protein